MSTITGGHTKGLSPDAVQTAIDAVLYERFEREAQPSYFGVRNGEFFRQDTIDTLSFIYDEDSNVGEFNETEEQEVIKTDNTFIGRQTTRNVIKFMKRVPVSAEAFKADQVGKRERIGRQIGDRGRLTQDKKGIIRTYGDAFDGNFFTCPDGQAMASNSHTALKTGDTIDNLETGALTPDTLWNTFVSLQTQLAQDGELAGYVASGVATNTTQYKALKEILNSELIANSAENNLNIFETDYGMVSIAQSPFLNSADDLGTYKATGVHVVSDGHEVTRKVHSEMSTDLIEPRYSDTDSWEFRARYQEVVFPGTFQGYAGLTGA